MAQGKLAIVSGFSGAGKSTVVRKLVETRDYELSVSCTTRGPREGEVDGKDYYFISREEFEKKIDEQDFLEWVRYLDNYYGTPLSFTKEKLAQGRNVILEIDAQGALQVKKLIPEAILIFVVAPTMTELKQRLTSRGTEASETVNRRLERAMEEIDLAPQYDFLMMNVDIDASVNLMDMMIRDGYGRAPLADGLLARLEKEGHEVLGL